MAKHKFTASEAGNLIVLEYGHSLFIHVDGKTYLTENPGNPYPGHRNTLNVDINLADTPEMLVERMKKAIEADRAEKLEQTRHWIEGKK